MRLVCCLVGAAILAGLASGCSGDKPAQPSNQAGPEEIVKKDCDNPKWKEQNLGLWYSVCRQPLRW